MCWDEMKCKRKSRDLSNVHWDVDICQEARPRLSDRLGIIKSTREPECHSWYLRQQSPPYKHSHYNTSNPQISLCASASTTNGELNAPTSPWSWLTSRNSSIPVLILSIPSSFEPASLPKIKPIATSSSKTSSPELQSRQQHVKATVQWPYSLGTKR